MSLPRHAEDSGHVYTLVVVLLDFGTLRAFRNENGRVKIQFELP